MIPQGAIPSGTRIDLYLGAALTTRVRRVLGAHAPPTIADVFTVRTLASPQR